MAVGIMEVFLMNAKGLKHTDFLGKIDPYVVIQYKDQERKSSILRGAGTNPTWNENIRFKVEFPGSGSNYNVILKLMDHDTFTADDFLGQATIYVKDLLALGVENGKGELPPTKYRVVTADQSYYGEVQVGVTFTLMAHKETNEEFGGWKESDY
ncbi:hypothetical protein ACFE04_001426 [Oxalis oulophora]